MPFVEVTAAGTTIPCQCGRVVEVPSLARLKASVGQAAVSADFELEQLAAAGRLPLETDCVFCNRRTVHEVPVVAECERLEEAREEGWSDSPWRILFVFLFGWLALLFFRRPARPERGRDLFLRLPIRVCETCAGGLTTFDTVRSAVRKTPLYARLLHKYPDARLMIQKLPRA